MANRFIIVGLGEALFDIFPDAQILGGAPLNVAIHAHQLGQPLGGSGVVVSRVGQDELGRQVLAELDRRGMDSGYMQTDPDRATGIVYVSLDGQGRPEYEIVRDVAWDVLQFDPDLDALARRCDAVCFGSLAQRGSQTRQTIQRFVRGARRAVRMFDVNLRQDFFNPQILSRNCEMASVVKINLEELPIVTQALGIFPQDTAVEDRADALAQQLLRRFDLQLVVLTRGEQGTVLYSGDERVEGDAIRYDPDPQAQAPPDAVGAGDACSAAILVGQVLRLPLDQTLALANHAGAFVAARPGATPQLPQVILDMVKTR